MVLIYTNLSLLWNWFPTVLCCFKTSLCTSHLLVSSLFQWLEVKNVYIWTMSKKRTSGIPHTSNSLKEMTRYRSRPWENTFHWLPKLIVSTHSLKRRSNVSILWSVNKMNKTNKYEQYNIPCNICMFWSIFAATVEQTVHT